MIIEENQKPRTMNGDFRESAAKPSGFCWGIRDRGVRTYQLLVEIWNLPVAHLFFHQDLDPDRVYSTYKYFTKRHPKYKVFANKSIGAAIIDLRAFSSSRDWLAKNNASSRTSAAYRARKARSRGYVFTEIDKNKFVDDIFEINTSLETRQGRKMDPAYLQKEMHYSSYKNYRYYGVQDSSGKLVAYCDLGLYGNFALSSRLLGHRDSLNDGVMYLLLVEIIFRLIDDRSVDYVMYDTWYGAQLGLKSFKSKLGFVPYRVKYSIR